MTRRRAARKKSYKTGVSKEAIRQQAQYFERYYKCEVRRGRPSDPKKPLIPRLMQHFGVSRRTIMRALEGLPRAKPKSKPAPAPAVQPVAAVTAPSPAPAPAPAGPRGDTIARGFAAAFAKSAGAGEPVDQAALEAALTAALAKKDFGSTHLGGIARYLRDNLRKA